MRTSLALQDFLASRIAANLSPATIEWYKDRLIPFVGKQHLRFFVDTPLDTASLLAERKVPCL